ncbi:tripartite tricarboxylate transporter TctB family protein [Psychrobacillus soli]|uniref:Tripartite tricarboxylate transporter TctB family protein n=1 Tax=Psychrobacillus soli TaxID=1543965 RepID=A0A544TKD2_9BACI|nr:tripartite tricarboxylate transporter TctB family protein [Psychrobacillus soli]TQR17883.1 tripartite tricarboxylate transporter TctB family protein [Psychrobacillus soli]
MNSKKATYIALTLIIILGLVYLKSAIDMGYGDTSTPGAGFFPILLVCMLVVLCIVSLIQTMMRTDDKKIDLPNIRLISLTVIISFLFILSWVWFGYFYISLFAYLLILMTVYYFEEMNKKRFGKNLVISLVLTVLIYGVFDYLLGLNLT